MAGAVADDDDPQVVEIAQEGRERRACAGGDLVGAHNPAGGQGRRDAIAPGHLQQLGHAGVADAALGHIDDALEGQIVGRLRDDAQIGQRVADFLALVEPGTADDAIGQAELDEAVFEFAHLERGAHQNGDLVERMILAPLARLALQLLDFLADAAGFLFAIPAAGDLHLFAVDVLGA